MWPKVPNKQNASCQCFYLKNDLTHIWAFHESAILVIVSVPKQNTVTRTDMKAKAFYKKRFNN